MLEDRKLFEDFHADPQFADLRKLRSQLQPMMKAFQSNIQAFQSASVSLDMSAVTRVRDYMLEMYQIEHTMISACKDLPPEFEKVKLRILEDFDTTDAAAYLAKINSWLRLIEGGH